MKANLVISFSGGRTSAYMTKYLLDNFSDKYNFYVVYANTGQEHEKTLEFINNCDKYFNFNTVWVEAIVHHNERKANTHKIVNYQTACRDSFLFEEMIKKHGIPNKAFPHCTRELKLAPIYSYLKSIGLKNGDYEMALGIRADEKRRVSESADVRNIIYPLVDLDIDKTDVLYWWSKQDFDLEIQEHQGNCLWCWKKTDKKHFRNIQSNPEWYDVPMMLEQKYPNVGSHQDKSLPRVFFRNNRSTKDMFKLYELAMGNLFPIDDTQSGGCSESCELFDMEEIK